MKKGEVPPNSECEETLHLSEEGTKNYKFPAFMSEKTIDDFEISDSKLFGRKNKHPKMIRSNRVSHVKCSPDTVSELEREAISRDTMF